MVFKIIVIIAAYFIGSISPAILLSKAKCIDIKKEGSGNAGTTNVLRVLGKKAALITLICDILKGAVPTLIGMIFGVECWCAIFAFIGHIWPVYYKFRGGKGAATAVGAVLALDWRIALLCLLVAAIFLLVSRRMSVGTLVAAVEFPILAAFLHPDILTPALVIAAIVIMKHKSNIERLIKGEEPKMSLFNKEKK